MFGSLLALTVTVALTFALPPPNGDDQTIQLQPLDQLLPVNVSKDDNATTFNASNDLQIQCDGEKYGFNPNVPDCQNARSYYKRSSILFTYGERHSVHPTEVFPLPFRLMGGKLQHFPQRPLTFVLSMFAKAESRCGRVLSGACPD